jgi:hypothetical protein
MDGSKMEDKVGYAVIKEEHTIKRRILPQNTIEAIQSEKNNRHEKVIITDSLSMIMAAENRKPTKNSKTQTIRKMLDHEGPRITSYRRTSYGHSVTWEYQVMKRPTKQRRKRWTSISQPLRYTDRRTEEMADRSEFQKERSKMEKRKQRDERKEAGSRRKGRYERNAKERASGNIQTQNRVNEGHGKGATSIYPSNTYCGNARKLRTRE